MKGESISELKKIKIRDNREPLVDLKKVCPEIIIGLELRRFKKEKSVYARRTVAEMLKKAQKLLPSQYRFKILDAFRPLEEQKRYYFNFYRRLKKKHPQWTKVQLKRETNKWIFPPDVGIVPYHLTGGAIDIFLCSKNGRTLSLKYKKNGDLLKNILKKVGFTNYEFEPWHWSYGDSGWALRTGKKVALYGKIN